MLLFLYKPLAHLEQLLRHLNGNGILGPIKAASTLVKIGLD